MNFKKWFQNCWQSGRSSEGHPRDVKGDDPDDKACETFKGTTDNCMQYVEMGEVEAEKKLGEGEGERSCLITRCFTK